ncbi:phosphotransferase family protein [Pseudonocardia sp. GCM10023141]|uniref:phosphotransferase family protein n=1 Tax=Pseudonocardia sp. GCM10023141 TaxID=3252653 RepID=UPI00361F62BF
MTEPQGVDLTAVGTWMDARGLPPGPFDEVTPLAGGTQNIMLRLRRGGRSYVLRRPPLHLRRRSNDALLREMRVLTALEPTPVPAPRVLATCPDPDVSGGAVFYLMEDIDGFNATVALPALHAGDAAVRHRMGLNTAAAVAALGAVDHVAVGLGDVGNPDGFLDRQVPRWMGELESYAQLPGYPGPDLPDVAGVAAWLDAHRPAAPRPGLMHGDYHLANVLFAHDGPRLAAIVDWEMVTVGDPLLDLGWLLATHPEPAAAGTSAIAAAGGLPTRSEHVAEYAAHSGRALSQLHDVIDFYEVLACFKLGIVLEGTHARACAGKAPKDIGDRLHTTAFGLFDRAGALIREAP